MYATPNVVTLYPIVLTLSRESGKIVLFYQVHVNVLNSVCVEYTIHLLIKYDNFAIQSMRFLPQIINVPDLIYLWKSVSYQFKSLIYSRFEQYSASFTTCHSMILTISHSTYKTFYLSCERIPGDSSIHTPLRSNL